MNYSMSSLMKWVVTVNLLTPLSAQTAESEPKLSRIHNAKTSTELSKAYRILFREVSEAQSDKLLQDKHDAIAISAAWERAQREVEEGDAQVASSSKHAALGRFVGFVEGRLGVAVPSWWEQSVMSVRRTEHFGFRFPAPNTPPFEKTRSGKLASIGTEIVSTAEGLIVSRDNHKCLIKRDLIERASRWGVVGSVSIATLEKNSCVALHGMASGHYVMFCIDRDSSEKAWETTVWAGGPGTAIAGWVFHWATVVVEDEVIYVFGINTDAAYIEAFAVKDGRALIRFATSY